MSFPEGSSLLCLTTEYDFKPFDCGDTDLNDFLLNDSKASMSHLQSVTYILENQQETIAFYSLLNHKISIEDFESNTQWKKWFNLKRPKRKNGYPAMKIGRLAVSSKYQNQNNGFKYMTESDKDHDTRAMYFDLITVVTSSSEV